MPNVRTLAVRGEHGFDIRDFGISSPPVLMFRIYPNVMVKLQLEAELAPGRPGAGVELRRGAGTASWPSLADDKLVRAFERAFILAELRAHEGNVTRTAEKLGIERSHLYRKLKGYGITPPKS
mgnify:CR=1 FL=1